MRSTHREDEPARPRRNRRRYLKTFRDWCERDYWTPMEFNLLLHGHEPVERPAWLLWAGNEPKTLQAFYGSLKIIHRCAGKSLKVKDKTAGDESMLLLSDSCLEWSAPGMRPHGFWIEAKNAHSGGRKPKKERISTQIRKQTLPIAKELWEENPNLTAEEVASHPRIVEIAGRYVVATRKKWIVPANPRGRGRPRKT